MEAQFWVQNSLRFIPHAILIHPLCPFFIFTHRIWTWGFFFFCEKLLKQVCSTENRDRYIIGIKIAQHHQPARLRAEIFLNFPYFRLTNGDGGDIIQPTYIGSSKNENAKRRVEHEHYDAQPRGIPMSALRPRRCWHPLGAGQPQKEYIYCAKQSLFIIIY